MEQIALWSRRSCKFTRCSQFGVSPKRAIPLLLLNQHRNNDNFGSPAHEAQFSKALQTRNGDLAGSGKGSNQHHRAGDEQISVDGSVTERNSHQISTWKAGFAKAEKCLAGFRGSVSRSWTRWSLRHRYLDPRLATLRQSAHCAVITAERHSSVPLAVRGSVMNVEDQQVEGRSFVSSQEPQLKGFGRSTPDRSKPRGQSLDGLSGCASQEVAAGDGKLSTDCPEGKIVADFDQERARKLEKAHDGFARGLVQQECTLGYASGPQVLVAAKLDQEINWFVRDHEGKQPCASGHRGGGSASASGAHP